MNYLPALQVIYSYGLKLICIFKVKINKLVVSVISSVSYFDKFFTTLQKYKSSITNYFKSQKNSDFVKKSKNKIKVAERRCYSFFKTDSLFHNIQSYLRKS